MQVERKINFMKDKKTQMFIRLDFGLKESYFIAQVLHIMVAATAATAAALAAR